MLKKATEGVYETVLNIPLPSSALQILEKLASLNYRGLLVGGCVRDAYLQSPSKDIDIEVYGPDYEELASILEEYGKCNFVGKSFGIIKLRDVDNNEYDFSLPRKDSKSSDTTDTAGRGIDTTIDATISIQDAASRRDFTLNSLAYDPLTNELFDYFGGIDDINNGILRATSSAFAEDPLRVLRGMQFAARFNLTVNPETAKLCEAIKDNPLVIERVSEEWMKLFEKGKYPSKGLQYLIDTGWIENYPELNAIVNVEQDSEWHPEGPVHVHTALAMDVAAHISDNNNITGEDKAVLVMGALTHDLGKATTTKEIDGKITSHGHDKEGVPFANNFLQSIGIPKKLVQQVLPLVEHHMVHITYNEDSRRNNILQIAEYLGSATIEQLLYVIESDHAARPPHDKELPESAKNMRTNAEEVGVLRGKVPPLVTGKDILLVYPSAQPGPLFAKILQEVRKAQLEKRISTKEEAYSLISSLLKKEYGYLSGNDLTTIGFSGKIVGDLLNTAWDLQRIGQLVSKESALQWVSDIIEYANAME